MADFGPKGSEFIGSGNNRLKINIDQPRWDQSRYIGRVKHSAVLTDVRNIFASSKQLNSAKTLLENYRSGAPMDRTTVNELWRAKYLHDSAFHPDTGEKITVLGRMSACIPVNTMLGGAMLTFRRSTAAIVFWQWMNQSVNAVINYSNRGGKQDISLQRMGLSYLCATTTAVSTAIGVNSLVKQMPPLIGRFVPFTAVVAASAVNIPIVRSQEIINGAELLDQNGNVVGYSRKAAVTGIAYVLLSRIFMVIPGMTVPPVLCDVLEKRGLLQRYPWIELPVQMLVIASTLIFTNPLGCAIFPQRLPIKVSRLEKKVQESLKKLDNPPTTVTFNKAVQIRCGIMSVEVTVDAKPLDVPEELSPPGSEYVGSGDKRLVIDIDHPRWDQNTFSGRFKHFFALTNPVNFFASNQRLEDAREIVKRYKCGAPMDDVTVDELWAAKQLFDTTYHPDIGEKVPLFTRKSATVPVDGTITGLLMSRFRSLPGIFFWQWMKQSHISAVAITNQSCDEPHIKLSHYSMAYMLATGAAVMTAIALGSFVKKKTPPVLGRLVPFAGVAAATCVSVPILRVMSLYDGIPVYDEENKPLGNSVKAAMSDITKCTLGTIAMFTPAMVLTPFLMARLEKQQLFCRYPWSHIPIQITLVSLCIMFASPMVCALFPEKNQMNFNSLEPGLQEQISKEKDLPPEVIYYKGSM